MANLEGIDLMQLDRIIGFNGAVTNGLKVHPDRQNLIYPLGCNIIIEEIAKEGYGSQTILSKHTDYVSCLAISPSGRYLASGQVTHMGFKAVIIIWDYVTKQPVHEMTLHKVKVEALAFSKNETYLISLGGQDDGSVVVWDVERGEAICGSPAQVESAGNTYCVCASEVSDDIFVTGGENTLRVWQLDVQNRKIRPTDVNLGVLKRTVKCIQMINKDNLNFFFCGTTTGDILAINMNTVRLQFLVPEKNKFSQGVTALSFVKVDECAENYDFLVGAGDGTLAQCKIKVTMNGNKIKATLKHNVEPWKDNLVKNKCSSLTSIALRGSGHQFFVGSGSSNIYKFNYPEFSCVLKKTCHSKPVNDVIFPHGTSELIVTCQDEEIRIWHRETGKEIRRHVVSNMMCNAIDITRDGKSIVSAWADGKIRVYGFGPKDITERFSITDAHNKGVTAIACTSDGRHIVSGGGEGQVRIWRVEESYESRGKTSYRGVLEATMKEHKGLVSAIKIRNNDRECASASTDGTCIIWCLVNQARKQIVFANTLFQCVSYGLGGHHIVTSGTDRKIAYWETLDGSGTRELDGAKTGAINTMDMSPDGKYFVSGGEEKIIKLWRYDEGEVTHIGIGHSAPITKVRICPNQRNIVSVGTDGAVLIWKFPAEDGYSGQMQQLECSS
ncbi:cilia- and flagella-associated protein 52-like [Haliotis rufescens]|uniref:cilia- and flagella-associated protein 52-like n=1 Tax=Haliotis rufescens TaxID=6454 RepID=UPI00201F66F8|nr:cilia- and flagella-associated protein 52-like [Haliotis rufescens]